MINRQEEILNLLQIHHTLSFHELAKMLFVSEPTARRDVEKLQKSGTVTRIYGGVTLAEYRNEVIPVSLRDGENSGAKELSAQKAAKLIADGDTVFLDASSTVRRICKYITDRKNLTVITNNMRVMADLQNTDITVYCTGGKYYKKRECFLGNLTERFIDNITVDTVFFSSIGISETGLITDVDEKEISLRRKVMSHAKRKVYVFDHSKIGIVKPLKECDAAEVDLLICDTAFELKA